MRREARIILQNLSIFYGEDEVVARRKFFVVVIAVLLIFLLLGIYENFSFRPGVVVVKSRAISWGLIKAVVVNNSIYIKKVDAVLKIWDNNTVVCTFSQSVLLLPFQRRMIRFCLPNTLKVIHYKYTIQIKQ